MVNPPKKEKDAFPFSFSFKATKMVDPTSTCPRIPRFGPSQVPPSELQRLCSALLRSEDAWLARAAAAAAAETDLEEAGAFPFSPLVARENPPFPSCPGFKQTSKQIEK